MNKRRAINIPTSTALVPINDYEPKLSNVELKALPPAEPEEENQVVPLKSVKGVGAGDGYIEAMDEFSLHRFVIRKGKVLDETPEFISYKRIFIGKWAGISYVIHMLEKLLTDK